MSDITKVPISRIDGLEDIAKGNFVKKTGDTMTGNLEISRNNSRLDLKNTALEAGVTPTDEVSTAVLFFDKNNVLVGYVDHDCLPDGRAMSRLNSRNMDASKAVSLTVGYTAGDVAYTSSPQINITNTSETPREVLVVRDTVLDGAATPSAVTTGGYITTRDANNRLITRIYSASLPTGPSNVCALQAWNADNSFDASLGIKVNKTGSYGEGLCPTPHADSNGAVIATTAWVRNLAANKDLSNLSSAGANVINNIANDAIDNALNTTIKNYIESYVNSAVANVLKRMNYNGAVKVEIPYQSGFNSRIHTYTAPSNGYLLGIIPRNAQNLRTDVLIINGKDIVEFYNVESADAYNEQNVGIQSMVLPVSAGDVISHKNQSSGYTGFVCTFVPMI